MPSAGARFAFNAASSLWSLLSRSTVRVVNTPPSRSTGIGERPALMHVLKFDLALAHNRVHTENISRHNLFQQVVTLRVAQVLEDAPQLLGLFNSA